VAFPTVAVVIPCYQHAHVLGAAIRSVLEQSSPVAEIVVVDDGSTDDPAAVASGYPLVRLIKQQNRGPSAARNRGLHAASSERIIFLDADDILLPGAVEAGLDCFASHPDAAFVYGGFEDVRDGQVHSRCIRVGSHADLVRCNWIGMIASAMIDRQKLLASGGFDEGLGMCEDWDVFLRLSRHYPFASHARMVAVYNRHDGSLSDNVPALLRWVETVRQFEKERGLDEEGLTAWREGPAAWASFYPDPPSAVQRMRGWFGRLSRYRGMP
jgi:glycosyltransferase involved in cell wall biosynthesis